MKKCCENCKHWEPHFDGFYDPDKHTGTGDCTRFPPVPIMVQSFNDELPVSMNPETGVLNKCGEFKPLKNPRRP